MPDPKPSSRWFSSDQPSLDVIILALLSAVVLMGVLTLFWRPAYEAGCYAVISTLLTVFGGACGAKFGLSQSPKQPSVEHPPSEPDQSVQEKP